MPKASIEAATGDVCDAIDEEGTVQQHYTTNNVQGLAMSQEVQRL
jgi:hypothetical protein